MGALALALGVFGAMATNGGVAWADTTGTSTSSSSSSDSSGDGSSGSTAGSGTPGTGAGTSTPGAVDDAPDSDQDADDSDDDDGDGDGDGDGGEDPDTAPADDTADDLAGEDTETGTETEPGEDTETGSGTGPDGTETETGDGTEPTDPADTGEPVIPASDTTGRSQDTSEITPESDTQEQARTELMTAAAITPMHAPSAAAAPNSLADWGKAIGTALNLPTPQQVIRPIQRAVVTCTCNIINGALGFLNGLVTPAATTEAPANPMQNTILWTVLGWARRQVDYAVAAFNRSLLGQWVNQVTTNATQWVADIGNSPWGRNISAQIGAFLAECQERVGLPEEFDRTTLISGLQEPTDFELITHEGENGEQHIHQILITEKGGAIKLYDTHTQSLTTLANLSVVTANGERGLIGIEVDPNFFDSTAVGYQKIYVAYTNAENYDQLSSFTLNGATLSDEQMLVESTLLANDFHHGGELEFDPTGQYLYWAVGNNTRPSENSQDLTNIHGKILRINRDGSGVVDNPFYVEGGDENTNRIYALGLRNPFRFGVDPETGAVLSGDVGEADWEELNLIKPGANYGWPLTEGAEGGGFADPIYAYPHAQGAGNGSITAVMVYDDGSPVAGQKKVWVADYSLGWIRELTFDDEYTSLISERTIDTGAGSVVKLTQGPGGEIYQLNIYPGSLQIITPSGGNRSPVAVIDASETSGAGDSLTVEFDAGNSTDPDGDTLTYSWNFGNGQTSTSAAETVTFTNTGEYTAYTVTLTVTDEGGKQTVTSQRIVVGSTPPVADFDVPAGQDYMYNAGDTVSFTATGSDPQDGPLADSAYSWKVVFHHADHTHPFINEVTGPELAFDIPRDFHQLSNTWYNVVLTVTDSSGLQTVVQKEIHPNLVTLTFDSNIPGGRYTLDGIPHTGPYTEQAVVGVERTLGAISPQTIDGQQYVFGSWEHGGTATQIITAPGTATSYTINYVPAPAVLPV
ncbi:PQQ-dependent sugar dehydrogenase [Mycobacterium sp. NPDC003323]